MPKRPQARSAGSAAAGSDADAKKATPRVHTASLTIMIPFNTEPEFYDESMIDFAVQLTHDVRVGRSDSFHRVGLRDQCGLTR